jgi:para-aminobenzoate synthetase component 1
VARNLVESSDDPGCLDGDGWWAVTVTFEGAFRAYRFASVSETPLDATTCTDVPLALWISSMSQHQYCAAVETVRGDIARGWVYQANICRVLQADLAQPINPIGAYQRLLRSNPAPHSGLLHVPGEWDIMSASPELLVSREGTRLMSSPIKGTARTVEEMLSKDRSENIMIVDLVRNDLSHIAVPGTVDVPHLLRTEQHPGLVHLVSDVTCEITPNTSWVDILASVLPAGSVSGAPKSSALETIARVEPTARGIYCGAFGWVDARTRRGKLAVGIRTFCQVPRGHGATLTFGTGAGITWDSDPLGEWNETQLKADRLLRVLDGSA